MKRISWLSLLLTSVILTAIACTPSTASALEEGEALPDGHTFRPVAFAANTEGPAVEALFMGLSKVTATLRESDDNDDEAKGKKVQTLKKQSDYALFTDLEPGNYDLVIQQGAAKAIADDIVVEDTLVIVSDFVTDLSIDFGGLEKVKAEVKLDDGQPDSFGKSVWSAKSQSGAHTYPVIIGSYDVRLRIGAAEHVVHGVNCADGPCSVSGIASDLSVDYGALANVKLELKADDGSNATIGKSVWSRSKQTGVVSYAVLRDSYDLRLRHGAVSYVVDGVDCSNSDCSVSGLTETLSVDYGGLAAVKLELRATDGTNGDVGGSVWSKRGQSGVVSYEVLRGNYDLRLRQAGATLVLDDVDCLSNACSVSEISQTLVVDLGDLTNVKVQLRDADGQPETLGKSVWTRNKQAGSTDHEVLRDVFDLKLVADGRTHIVDGVDCRSSECRVSLLGGVVTNHSPALTDYGPALVHPTPTPEARRTQAWRNDSRPTRVAPDGTVWVIRATATPVPPTPTPAVPPGAVQNLEVQPGDGNALLTWEAPEDVGGSPIQTYRVIIQPLQRVALVNASLDHLLIEGLENGVPHHIQINAISAGGHGKRTLTHEFVPLPGLLVERDAVSESAILPLDN